MRRSRLPPAQLRAAIFQIRKQSPTTAPQLGRDPERPFGDRPRKLGRWLVRSDRRRTKRRHAQFTLARPKERGVSRHRPSVAMLYPNCQTAAAVPAAANSANQPAGKSLAGKRTASASSKVDQPFPLTWDEIALDLLVLAKQDGPWGSWFEASRSKATATALRCVGGITNE
jgi:hypothetical protein